MALRIWVKPSNLHYKAEVICHQWHSAHFVGSEHAVVKRTVIIRTEVKHSADFEDLWIKTDLSSCDQNDPKAFIRITRLNSNETKQFDLIKTDY
uniref:Uncharacterized protein n=1 Tax=Globodera rostochiensis TaxID=31243 RepID=A0A914HX23_GLORO